MLDETKNLTVVPQSTLPIAKESAGLQLALEVIDTELRRLQIIHDDAQSTGNQLKRGYVFAGIRAVENVRLNLIAAATTLQKETRQC